MRKTNSEARAFTAEFLPSLLKQDLSEFNLFIIPSFTAVQLVRDAVDAAGVLLKVGAQNVHWDDGIESTGEISARILADIPVDLVEIGHSERRQKFGESDLEVRKKGRAVLDRGLTALICIGESLTEKEDGSGSEALARQVREGLAGVAPEELDKVMLAYEPKWAIGVAGKPADPSYVQEKHRAIREVLGQLYSPPVAAEVPLLYGGSVNEGNFCSYAELENVDGLFVGRSAWEAKSFLNLIELGRAYL